MIADLAALYDALNCAADATVFAEDALDPARAARAERSLIAANVAAFDAFPPGSDEAEALNLILGAIGQALANGVPA